MKQILLIVLFVGMAVLLPAALIALGLSLLFGKFLAFFLVLTGLIYVIGLVANKFSEIKTNGKIVELNEYISKKMLDQTLEVSCAYCGVKHLIPIRVDERNTFECSKCKKTNLIIFQYTTAQLTTPLVVGDKTVPDVTPKAEINV